MAKFGTADGVRVGVDVLSERLGRTARKVIIAISGGMVMGSSAIVLIMAPILYPVAVKLGVDPVHFGIMMGVNMKIGLCTPPVGLNLYVGSAISRPGLTEVSKATMPWR